MIQIKKRDGKIESFDSTKIHRAIQKAVYSVYGDNDFEWPIHIATAIEKEITKDDKQITVEDIQDMVEIALMDYDKKVAKAYILYRNERGKKRNKFKYEFLTPDLISYYKHLSDPFPEEMGKIVYYRTYARPVEEENRREYWWETVARVVDFSTKLEKDAILKIRNYTFEDEARLRTEAAKMFDYIFNLKLFPSGRSLWTGGTKASFLYPLSNFNCSFCVLDSYKKFSEIFSLLMLGTGAGLSVESKYINKLPRINTNIEIIHKSLERVAKKDRKEFSELKQLSKNVLEIVVGDSKFGWSQALEYYFQIISLRQYSDIEFILLNYDNVRPAGERLKTFGGYASGEQAILQMFEKISNIFLKKKEENQTVWYRVKPIDVLDIATIIAENVVSGGVRRSSLIVFCDPHDTEVITAKNNIYHQNNNGEWEANKSIIHRMLSNNTIMYSEKPSIEEIKKHFEMIRYSGEPGWGNLQEMKRRRPDVQGGNPCFEILLRDRGVCNLTEQNMMAFVNSDGTYDKESMLEAQRLSAIIGYRMATIELEIPEWNMVNEEDALTGCSLTGVMDFKNATKMNDQEFAKLLRELRDVAHQETKRLAHQLKRNEPKLVTCIKPSGTISQLPTVSSGVHFSHSPYFIRRVRINANDPLCKALQKSGFPWNPEVGQTLENYKTAVFEFPIKAPNGKTKYDVSAIEQLELYKLIMENYVDHNASNTVHVRNNEWDAVVEWVYNNWDSVVGITFISLDDSFYQLMPYESISEEQYLKLKQQLPKFNVAALQEFETFEIEFELDSDCDTGHCPVR